MSLRTTRNSILQCLIVGMCLLFICAARTAARQDAQSATSSPAKFSNFAVKFQEQPISKVPGGSELEDLQAANGHVAWVEQKFSSSNWMVHRDGERWGGKYLGVKYLEFSPDGEHLAFFGQRDAKWLLVLDGKEIPAEYFDVAPVVFQPHGTSWAFGACVAEESCRVIVSGEPSGAAYEQVSLPLYSLDGRRLAYLGQLRDKWTAIVDGQEVGPQTDTYSCFGFSPDGAHFFACGARKRIGWSYFIDGAPGPPFAQLSPITFSNDGNHYLYAGSSVHHGFEKNATTGTIVLDGKAGAVYEGSGLPGEWILLVNAPIVVAEVYSGGSFISPLLFVPGQLVPGARVLSARLNGVSDPIFGGSGNPVYAARRGKNDIVVIDGGQSGPAFDDVMCDIVFSNDGRHSAYVALRGKDIVEVLDGQLGKAVPLDSKPISKVAKNVPADSSENSGTDKPAAVDPEPFSIGWTALTPHASHFAYELIRGGIRFKNGRTLRAERTVVLDGQPEKRYNALGISAIQFSENERHYWYTVSGADGKKGLVVVDGHQSKLYNSLTEAQFDPASKGVIFFARAGSRIIRVTILLPD